ncbi:hypothetical protein [Spirosoma luteum]|uniref:hypothetical protein n=1 Tax=Spirosoma luteum TaxID=431553 RepID=UPI00037DB582|nr:hypothetical protein [Spirosoma luteum]
MKPRKTKDLQQVLEKKGFMLNPAKDHHQFYSLFIDGKKQVVYTYLSHGGKEYGKTLMGSVKKQLKFTDIQKAEDFFDCPMSAEKYVEMLREDGHIK